MAQLLVSGCAMRFWSFTFAIWAGGVSRESLAVRCSLFAPGFQALHRDVDRKKASSFLMS